MPIDINTESSPTLVTARPPDRNERRLAMHELLYIIWLVTAFMSSIASVVNNTPHENSAMIHFVITGHSLLFLGEVLGERLSALIAIFCATLVALFDIYMGGNITIFVPCLIVTFLCFLAFSLITLRKSKLARRSSFGSKLFIKSTLILKSLLDNGVIPTKNINEGKISIIVDLQHAFFVESFLLSIMGLWMQASGIPILNPTRRTSFSLASQNWPSIIASILYWIGAFFVVANVILTIAISPIETPIVIQVACAVFVVCTTAILFKAPVDLEDD